MGPKVGELSWVSASHRGHLESHLFKSQSMSGEAGIYSLENTKQQSYLKYSKSLMSISVRLLSQQWPRHGAAQLNEIDSRHFGKR